MSDQIPSPPPGPTPAPSGADAGGGRYAPPPGYALAPAPVAPYGNPLRPSDSPYGVPVAGPPPAAAATLGIIAFVQSWNSYIIPLILTSFRSIIVISSHLQEHRTTFGMFI